MPPLLCFLGNQTQSSSTVDGSLQRRDSARRRASAHLPPKNNHLVISGGDGYEDFRLTNSSETVGRDDSTNHLLLWRVWDNRSRVWATQPPSSWEQRTSPVLSLQSDSSLFGVVLVFCSVHQSLCAYGCQLPLGLTNEYDHFGPSLLVLMFLVACVVPHWVVFVRVCFCFLALDVFCI